MELADKWAQSIRDSKQLVCAVIIWNNCMQYVSVSDNNCQATWRGYYSSNNYHQLVHYMK